MSKRIDSEYTKKERKFWVSTPKTSGEVHVNARGLICSAPPIWRRFKDRSLFALTSFLKETSIVQVEELK